ncbi:mucin-binding protein [Lactiplantibacillus plantarum]|uniref:mucin-binding protein n=1 Tax=Lactiplantibacillus plantarum TaxID=1590 RepID=UPI0015EC5A5C|nr:KxYKxGKxW signal peptide domain-containing protein [Lactiplantibacillus plantarum]MBA3076158.1 KxYKxGKxW signal peptide domain-containing protein [Lactiplantibacillus plantarum]MBA3079414.1 KxYKxGKxW signal peptide domain-containing protein [Lactiplantibacillus plantarum]MBA3081955.1 KxYKxGKxW signal peptide domain-containing protein [Lactiplantibacillus plantarum]MCG0772971.1 mucus-binding protein [Lactiplantibacillus plantarum]MDT4757972.1 KxYKxGKxW signal peptide domain-containing protei
MRNRLNRLGLESKSHYKLYKSGRRWVAASITVFSVGIGLTFSQVEQVKAATGTGVDTADNSASVSSDMAEPSNAVVLKSASTATATKTATQDAKAATDVTAATQDTKATTDSTGATSASSNRQSTAATKPAAEVGTASSRADSSASISSTDGASASAPSVTSKSTDKEATSASATKTATTSADTDVLNTETTSSSVANDLTDATTASQTRTETGKTASIPTAEAPTITTAVTSRALPLTGALASRSANTPVTKSTVQAVSAITSEAETKPTVSLVTTGTVSMDYGEASLADLESHISSPDETPANDVAYYIQDAAGNYLEDVNGNKVNLLYALFLDSADVNDYVDVVYTDEHGQVTKYSGDTDFSTLDQIGSYSVTINAAGKAGMSRVMQDYNAYDTSTSDLDDFVPTFSTGASDYTFTINIVPVKITATTGKNGLIILRPSQLYTGSLTMLPVVTVKNATKQNILQISNGEIGDAKPGVAGKVGQRVLTLADFTYTYQGTETNLTGADTGKYAITLNDAGRKAVQAALGSNYILDDAAVFTTTGAVQAAGLELKIASGTVTYNGKPQGTSVTTGTVYDHFDFTTTTDTNVGTYDDLTYALADPTQAAILAKNYTVTTTDGTLVITPADLTVTVKDDNAVYDGRSHGTTATVTSGTNCDQLAFTAVAADGSGATTYTTVGTYAMTGTTAADTSNYKISYVNGTLTIDPTKATITIPNKIYWSDGTQKNLAAVVTGTVNGETLKYRVTNGMSAVGTKTITATPDADDSVNKNYTISVIPGTLTIGDIAVKYLYEHVDANGETQVDASETGTATHATDATATDYLTYTTAAKPKTGYVLAPNTGLAYNGTLTDQGGTVTYRYLAKTETAIVTYFDQTDNKVIKTEPLQGAYGTTDAYRTADTIAAYENAGYDLVDDDYPTAGVVYDQDGIVQKYQVTLVHKFVTRTPDNPGTPGEPIDPDNPNGPTYPVGTDFEDLTEQVSQTIQYLYKDGRTAKPNNVQAVNFSRNVTVDEVNGTVVYTDWLTDDGTMTGRFEAVDSPSITGYTADPTSVAGRDTVSGTDLSPDVQVYYQANPEKATVTYEDTTTGAVLTTDPITGDYQTVSNYRTADRIAQYLNMGYELVSDDYPTSGAVFDKDGSTQAYTVKLQHKLLPLTPENPGTPGEPIDPDNPNGPTYPAGTAVQDLIKQVDQTIHYQYQDKSTAADANTQTITFKRSVTVDEVNNKLTYTDWLTGTATTGRYMPVDSPEIKGYVADSTRIAGNDEVHNADADTNIVVTYQAKPENATVTYVDVTTGKTLAIKSLTGDYQTTSSYRTSETIASYVKNGYQLVRDNYPTSGAVFDVDNFAKTYTVTLKHKLATVTPENPGTPGQPIDPDNPDGPKYPVGTTAQDLTKQVSQTIKYRYQNGASAGTDNVQLITFNRDATIDEVDPTAVYTDWLNGTSATGRYTTVMSPVITGYTADKTQVAGRDSVANTDSDTQVVVTYAAKPEKATVTYVDVTTGKTLATANLTGGYRTQSNYRTAETIAGYVKNGYELVRDNYPVSGMLFDVDDFAKTYTVTLKHKLVTVTPGNPGTPGQPIDPDNPDGPKYPVGTTAQDLTKQVSQTIKYRYQNGASAGTDSVQLITFNRDATIDEVEPTVVYTDWLDGTSATGRYTTVTSPVIIGYTADRARVTGNDAVTSAAQPTNIIVTYALNAEKATVTYVDVTTDKTLATVSLTGDYQTSSDYRTANTIADYSNQGYVLVRDSYPVSGAIFNDDGVVHSYLVQLAHVTTATTETKTITQTVHYQSTTGTQLHDDTVRAMTFTRTKRVDQVTGDVTYSNWSTNQADHTFERVAAFSIPGYHAVVTGTQAVMVTPASVDDVQTIRYVTDRPSTGETPKTPVKTVTVNKSDKIKTTDTPDKVATVKTPDKAQTVATTTAKQASVKRSVDLKQAQAVEQPAQTRPANVKTVKLAKTTKSVKPTAAHQSATHKQATLPQTNDNRQASVAAELLGLTAATLLVGVSAILKKRHN